MDTAQIRQALHEGRTALGVELGSTRIKAVLIAENGEPIASGAYDWENRLENGIWTYSLDEVWTGVQTCYAALAQQVNERYNEKLRKVSGIGFSAMMHGYLAFDKDGAQLAQFRTWRNTMTEQAAHDLTALFGFNIPQRWSVAHLYQAILNGEQHVKDVAFLTTLAGYVHWKLTGRRVLGVGDASGMFPIGDSLDYNAEMLAKFDAAVADKGYPWTLRALLPDVLDAGTDAGALTAEGARLLDPTGALEAGIPFAPPEGDAGTGMVATNSVAQRTGNVSAGTSIFAMLVLEKSLTRVYPEIDMVTTPTGKPVAMVHCNSCTSDINAWAEVLQGFAASVGRDCTMPQVLDAIFFAALEGDKDCGGVVSYNYFSGEPVTGLDEGRPLLVRMPDARFNFANFARAQIYAAIATLKLGMDILTEQEKVRVDTLLGHGGFFKAKGVGQKLMAAALDTPVSVMSTAGEGGPWGMALLAAYRVNHAEGQTLESYLADKIFAGAQGTCVQPDAEDAKGFAAYMERYAAGLAVQRAAVKALR